MGQAYPCPDIPYVPVDFCAWLTANRQSPAGGIFQILVYLRPFTESETLTFNEVPQQVFAFSAEPVYVFACGFIHGANFPDRQPESTS
jgi:hypothetical protein